MAITAITAQNTRRVDSWRAEPPEMIAAQIDAVFGKKGGLPIRAIKTGLLPGAPAVRAVARALKRWPRVPLVVDPVVGSTTGTQFLDAAGVRVLRRELLPLATLVTPNWPEAEALSGCRIESFADAERVARELAGHLGCAVLLKGGHAPGEVCRDYLATPGGKLRLFESPRVATQNTHGTGCVLSAAIATELAHGISLERAVVNSRRFLERSLHAGRRTNWRGAGPAFAG